jgi:ABC-2 type transport system permease protein
VIRAAFIIAGKDLKQRLRDRSAWILAVLVPLGLAFVLNLTLSGISGEGFSASFVLYDADGGNTALAFGEVLREVETQGFAEVTVVSTEAEARAAVGEESIAAAFLIPQGFSAAVEANQAAEITVVANPDFPIGSQVARAVATGFVEEANAVRLSVGSVVALGGSVGPDLVAAAQSASSPILLANPQTEGGGFDYATFYAIGIAVFFLFFTVQFGILSLIDEREAGTMTRLVAAPIPRSSILLGKLLVSFSIGFASTIVLWLATSLLMSADWGSVVGVMLLIAAGVAAAMGITAAVAVFARTSDQAASATAFIVVVFGMLGGAFFPVTRAAGFLDLLSRITPHFWLMEGLRNLAAGDSVDQILPQTGAVLLFAAALLTIGLLGARRLVRQR